MATGTNPQKKDLFHKLVKKVRVHDRRTIEVWYGLPNPRRFEHWNNWLPKWDAKQTFGARECPPEMTFCDFPIG